MQTKPEDILKRLNRLKANNASWKGVWADCARYCFPNAQPVGSLRKMPEGAEKAQPNDTMGVEAARSLASWLYSSTVYQGEQWFSLKAIPKGGRVPAMTSATKKFLEQLSAETLSLLANSNFAQVYQEMLQAYCVFGTGVFYCEYSEEEGRIKARQYSITEGVYVDENADGEIDTVFREFDMTTRQAAQAFGLKNLPAKLQSEYANESDRDKKHAFVHAVFPRAEYDKSKKLPSEKPWASLYVLKEEKFVVEDGGHDSFPYCVPRFDKLCNEVYGRSPAMSALPVLRTISRATESFVRACEFAAHPMCFVPPELIDKVDMNPGTVNPCDMTKGGGVVIWSGGTNIQIVNDFIIERQKRVEKLFYCDVFEYLEDRKNMSATEARLRYDEMIQAVAPVLSRLHTEFFTRLIKRVALLAIENGIVDASAFAEAGGLPEFDIEYTTRLDTKIKSILTANIVNFVRMSSEVLGIVAQVPNADVYLATERIIEKFAEANNVMTDALRSDDEIAAKKEAIAKAQQQQVEMSMTKPVDLQKTPERGSQMDILQRGGLL